MLSIKKSIYNIYLTLLVLFTFNPSHSLLASTTICDQSLITIKSNPQLSPFWKARFEKFLSDRSNKDAKIVFLGDSITEWWETSGIRSWNKYFLKKGAINFGCSSDTVENLKWRLENGNLNKLDSPEKFVLLIGTNNIINNSVEYIKYAIVEIIDFIKDNYTNLKQQPEIVLIGVLPRNCKVDIRQKIYSLNESLKSEYSNDSQVTTLDLSSSFSTPEEDGKLKCELYTDGLHLTEKGYELLATMIEKSFLKKKINEFP